MISSEEPRALAFTSFFKENVKNEKTMYNMYVTNLTSIESHNKPFKNRFASHDEWMISARHYYRFPLSFSFRKDISQLAER